MEIVLAAASLRAVLIIDPTNAALLEQAQEVTGFFDSIHEEDPTKVCVNIVTSSIEDRKQLDAWFTAFCLVLAKMEEGEAAASEGAL